MNPITRTLKVLGSLPALAVAAFKSTYSLTTLPLSEWYQGLKIEGQGWFDASYAKLARLCFTNPVSSRALRLVAQAAADAPVYVEKRGSDGSWVLLEKPDRSVSDALALVGRPNARTTRETAMLAIYAALYCGGELWVDGMDAPLTGPNRGRPKALRYIMPDEFAGFRRDPATDEIVGYKFKNRRTQKGYSRTVDECRHVRLFHPLDDDRGLAVLVAAAAQIDQMQSATEWNSSLSKGGGRIPGLWRPASGTLQPGTTLTTEAQASVQASLNSAQRRVLKEGGDLVLSGAVERVDGDTTPRDADFTKAQAMSLRFIAATMGVPPVLLGDEKGGSLTDAGVDSEVEALYKLTVLPSLSLVLAELSAFLLPDGYRFAVDTDQIPALQEDRDAMFTRYNLVEVLTEKERRVGGGYSAEVAPDMADPVRDTPPPTLPDDSVTRAAKTLTDAAWDTLLAQIPEAVA